MPVFPLKSNAFDKLDISYNRRSWSTKRGRYSDFFQNTTIAEILKVGNPALKPTVH